MRSVCALSLALLASCQNSGKKLQNLSPSTNGTPINTNGYSATSIFTLTRAVRSPSDTAHAVDIIDDGKGVMNQYCVPSGSGQSNNFSGNYGPTSCTCEFSYGRQNTGVNEKHSVPTSYVETDLVRCLFSDPNGFTLPLDAVNVVVAVKHTPTGQLSNSVRFDLLSGGTGDTSNALNYRSALRHQCRDYQFIPNFLDGSSGSPYDPLQSEDGTISQPLNFYVTNNAPEMLKFATYFRDHADLARWDCPVAYPSPGPSQSPPPSFVDVTGRDLKARIDLRLFLESATLADAEKDTTGTLKTKQVAPPQKNFPNHSDFVLAARSMPGFDVPVRIGTYPGVADVIGYAAKPQRNSNGTESCPASPIVVPQGYTWAKLWLYRTSLDPRIYYSSNNFKRYMNWVACKPEKYQGDPDGEAVVKECPEPMANPSSAPLFDRVLGINNDSQNPNNADIRKGVCIKMGKDRTTDLQTYFTTNDSPVAPSPLPVPVKITSCPGGMCSSAGLTTKTDLSGVLTAYLPNSTTHTETIALGTDIWHPSFQTNPNPVPSGSVCGGYRYDYRGGVNDPLGLCTSDLNAAGEVAFGPVVDNDEKHFLDAHSRWDYVFYVTDVNHHTPAMSNTIFYRFYSPDQCSKAADQNTGYSNQDPDDRIDVPRDASCGYTYRARYGVKLYDFLSDSTGDGSDQSAQSQGYQQLYPLCVLQKAGGS